MHCRSCVVLAASAAALVVLAGGTTAAKRAQRPLKVYLSVDMEGITGVVQPAQLGPQGFEYERAREFMTGEVNAALEAARAAGASEFVIADSHGNAQSLLIDQLPNDVRIVRGFPRPLSMMQGIDESFSAVLLIGYHGSEYAMDAVRGHTFSSARLLGVKLNGMEVSEGIYNAAIAGHFGVPVVFISGDRTAVTQFQRVVPAAEGAIVKEAFGYHSAVTVTPEKGREMIRGGVIRALKKLGEAQPYRIQTPIQLEVGFKLTIDAERAAYVPGLTRIDVHTVRGTFPDLLQITKLLTVLESLEQP